MLWRTAYFPNAAVGFPPDQFQVLHHLELERPSDLVLRKPYTTAMV